MTDLTYAIVGGPPADWYDLRVFDADGNKIKEVVEVHTTEGCLIRHRVDEKGALIVENDAVATERIAGAFTINRTSGLCHGMHHPPLRTSRPRRMPGLLRQRTGSRGPSASRADRNGLCCR